jgi:hypothetical protein
MIDAARLDLARALCTERHAAAEHHRLVAMARRSGRTRTTKGVGARLRELLPRRRRAVATECSPALGA